MKKLIKSTNERLKSETIIHYLADVDTLAVTCNDKKEGEKFTLERHLVNCHICLLILNRFTGELDEPTEQNY